MDQTQEKFERAVGDVFVEWYNQNSHSNFLYSGRPDRAPDLLYIDGSRKLNIEVVGAYPGKQEAAFWWQNLRKAPNTPQQVFAKDMDESLIGDISKRIEEKCEKAYGTNCLLLVYVHPAMTTAEEIEELFDCIEIPKINPFQAIFLSGHFPISSSGSIGGYRCWKICEN